MRYKMLSVIFAVLCITLCLLLKNSMQNEYNARVKIENLEDEYARLKEDTIPKSQYVDDIEYLEHEILALRENQNCS